MAGIVQKHSGWSARITPEPERALNVMHFAASIVITKRLNSQEEILLFHVVRQWPVIFLNIQDPKVAAAGNCQGKPADQFLRRILQGRLVQPYTTGGLFYQFCF